MHKTPISHILALAAGYVVWQMIGGVVGLIVAVIVVVPAIEMVFAAMGGAFSGGGDKPTGSVPEDPATSPVQEETKQTAPPVLKSDAVAPQKKPQVRARMAGMAPEQQPTARLDFESCLLPILQKYKGKNDFYIAPDIDQEKLLNAFESCNIPDSEEVAALVDCTVMGGAKNYLVIGAFGIYFHNDWSGCTPGPGKILYTDLPNGRAAKRGVFEVWVDDKRSLNVSGCSMGRKNIVSLLSDLQAACRGRLISCAPAETPQEAPEQDDENMGPSTGASFTFACPHCSQHLEAEQDMVAQTVECPSCSREITIPDGSNLQEA
jgi:DNA-directed RNA polymerase subunit RPC12/RpoP